MCRVLPRLPSSLREAAARPFVYLSPRSLLISIKYSALSITSFLSSKFFGELLMAAKYLSHICRVADMGGGSVHHTHSGEA